MPRKPSARPSPSTRPARGTRTAGRPVRRGGETRASERRPPTVDAPWELEQELRNDAHVRAAYDAMPPSQRSAYGKFIEEAKHPETRVRRVQQALRMITQWAAERQAKTRKRR